MSAPDQAENIISSLIKTDMNTPLDKIIVHPILASQPFLPIPGALNLRDLGLVPNSPIKPGLIYRSGSVYKISPSDLQSLDIGLILDLRSEREVAATPSPAIDGIQNVHIAPTRMPTPIQMEKFAADSGVAGYVAMYLEILSIYAPSIDAALKWIRDEQKPILFHCTAGKDRTGVLAAVILSLAGASQDVVAFDYSLTRVGVEPEREMLIRMLAMWNREWTGETVGMREFVQVRGEFISGFLEEVGKRWGGVAGWVESVLGWKGEELERLKGVMREGREFSVENKSNE